MLKQYLELDSQAVLGLAKELELSSHELEAKTVESATELVSALIELGLEAEHLWREM